MGLGSQNLTKNEIRVFKKILKEKKELGERARTGFNKKLGKISKTVVKANSTLSKDIAEKIRKEIIDPFRRRHRDL